MKPLVRCHAAIDAALHGPGTVPLLRQTATLAGPNIHTAVLSALRIFLEARADADKSADAVSSGFLNAEELDSALVPRGPGSWLHLAGTREATFAMDLPTTAGSLQPGDAAKVLAEDMPRLMSVPQRLTTALVAKIRSVMLSQQCPTLVRASRVCAKAASRSNLRTMLTAARM